MTALDNDLSPMASAASMDPELMNTLMQFYSSNPAFAAEYNRHMAWATPGTDQRTPAEWMFDAIKSDQGLLSEFQGYANTPATNANAELVEEVPLEQDLLDRVLNDYLYPDLEQDKQRRQQAQGVLDRYNGAIDEAIRINQGNLNGNRLKDELAYSESLGSRLGSALDTEFGSRMSAIDSLQADRLAALDPVTSARSKAAQTEIAAINQGLERTRDQITAADAMSGFVGGSSMKDAELARAAIGARQRGAATLGAADFANASDRRGVFDETATGRAGARFDLASGKRNVEGQVVDWDKNYFDNDWGRRLSSALVPATLETNRLQTLGAADDFGWSGLKRGLDTLNWFSTSANPVSMQQPNLLTYQQTASQAGNDLAGLGAGLFSAGLKNSSNWNWFKKGEDYTNSANDD